MRLIIRLVERLEDALLVILLLAMVGLASLQIVLRNGFDTGLVWIDEFLRILVLWLAMAGAMAASRYDRHLAIDVLTKQLPMRPRLFAMALVNFFTASIVGLLAYHSYRFVMEAREFEDTVLTNLPAWWFQSILPVGFGLIASRYLAFALMRVWASARNANADPVSVDDIKRAA